MSEEDAQRFVTPEFVARYVWLDEKREPKANTKQEFKPYWGLAIVLPKDHEFWDLADQKIDAAIAHKFPEIDPEEFEGRNPIKDGDDWEDEDFHGCYVLEMKNTRRKPGIKVFNPDGANEDVVDMESEIYAGMVCVCTARMGGYDKGSDGIGAYLNNVLKVGDGERIGPGSTSAESDFESYVSAGGSKKKSSRKKRGSKKSGRRKKGHDPLA